MTRRRPTALEQLNVEAVSALLAENDELRERLANRNLVIIVLCLAIMVGCLLTVLA